MSCTQCTLEGKIKTNNAAHTACIDNPALLSTSVVEVMFNRGVALSITFGIVVIFLGLAVAIHYMKAKYPSEEEEESLGKLDFQQVVLKAALPGFSFGSEVVLIWGMMTESQGFGETMLVFRMLHPLTMIVLTCTLFAFDDAFLSERLRKMVHMSRLNEKFVRKNVAPVGLLVLVSGCDVTMLQLMPWQQTKFYEESMGYPCFDMMVICMIVKALQSLVSVICQIAYLVTNSDLNDPTMSTQAKALFGMSIILSSVSLIMSLVMLFLKYALLKKVEEEEEKEEKEKAQKAKMQQEDSNIEMGDVYRNNDEVLAVDGMHNPMHSAVMEIVEQQKLEIQAKTDEIAKLRSENEELRQHCRVDAALL